MTKIFTNNKTTFLFFLLLTLLFYGNSIKNGFCFDDSYVTVTNYPVKGKKFIPDQPLVAQGFKGIPKIWQSRFGHDGGAYDYRPVVNTLFAIEYAVFGQSPAINHFTSILLYALIVFYLFRILKFCLRQYPYGETFALISAILFLVHPVHTEVVNNIKCCDELLTFLFGLLTLFNLIQFFNARQKKYLFYSVVFILLSFFTKLNSIMFIALIPLTLLFFIKIEKKQALYVFLGLSALFLIHNLIRDLIVTEKEVRVYYHFENPLFTEKISFFANILFSLKTLGTYLQLLFVAYPLRFYYGTDMVPLHSTITDAKIIFAVIFLLAAGSYCFKTKNKIALYGLLFFLIAIGPILNFMNAVAGIMGDRLCFVASTGFVIFIVSVLFSISKTIPAQIDAGLFTKKPVIWLLPIMFVSLIYTWNRNTVWKNEITLFEHDAPYLERSAGANNLLANKYYEMLSFSTSTYPQQELIDKCLYHFKLAYTNDSTLYTALNNTGAITFMYLHKPAEALTFFVRAANSNPVYPQAYENIGDCYKALGNPGLALKYYEKAISQNVKQYRSYLQMVKLLMERGYYKAAFNVLKLTEVDFPNDYQLTIQKGNYYLKTGKYEEAALKYEQAYASRATKELAHSLFITYKNLQNEEKAAYYKKQYEAPGL